MESTRKGKSFQALVADAKTQINEIDCATLKDWLTERRPLVVLDVRETLEYQNGFIPGAINLTRGILELEIDSVVPSQDQPLLLYCGGGSRSALAAQTLKAMGYDNVYSLTGGFRQWQSQYPNG